MTHTVKNLKTADYVIQLILIISAVILGILNYIKPSGADYIFLGYFVVGGWQIMSVIIHLFYPPSRKSKLRKIYLIFLAIVLGLVGLGLFINPILFLFGLLIVSPMLALLYVVACIRETKQWSIPGEEKISAEMAEITMETQQSPQENL